MRTSIGAAEWGCAAGAARRASGGAGYAAACRPPRRGRPQDTTEQLCWNCREACMDIRSAHLWNAGGLLLLLLPPPPRRAVYTVRWVDRRGRVRSAPVLECRCRLCKQATAAASAAAIGLGLCLHGLPLGLGLPLLACLPSRRRPSCRCSSCRCCRRRITQAHRTQQVAQLLPGCRGVLRRHCGRGRKSNLYKCRPLCTERWQSPVHPQAGYGCTPSWQLQLFVLTWLAGAGVVRGKAVPQADGHAAVLAHEAVCARQFLAAACYRAAHLLVHLHESWRARGRCGSQPLYQERACDAGAVHKVHSVAVER